MTDLKDIRYRTDDFMEMWAIAHQEHPVYEWGPKQRLWLYALAKRRASLEQALANYRFEKRSGMSLKMQGGSTHGTEGKEARG